MRHYGASDGLDMDKLNSALAKLLRLARTSLNKDKRRSESMLAAALSLFQLHFAFIGEGIKVEKLRLILFISI